MRPMSVRAPGEGADRKAGKQAGAKEVTVDEEGRVGWRTRAVAGRGQAEDRACLQGARLASKHGAPHQGEREEGAEMGRR